MGTGGVLLAVQLLIGALQSKKVQEFVLSLFSATNAVRELRNSLHDATDVYGEQIGKLQTQTRLYATKRTHDYPKADIQQEQQQNHGKYNDKYKDKHK